MTLSTCIDASPMRLHVSHIQQRCGARHTLNWVHLGRLPQHDLASHRPAASTSQQHSAPPTSSGSPAAKALTRQITNCNDPATILQLCTTNPDVGAINISAAFVRLAKLFDAPFHDPSSPTAQAQRTQATLSLLRTLSPAILAQCGAREIGTILQSLAKLQPAPSPAYHALLTPVLTYLGRSAARLLANPDPRSVACIAWSLTKLDAPSPDHGALYATLCEDLSSAATASISHFTARDVSMTAWAFSTWPPATRQPHARHRQRLFAALLHRASAILDEFQPQGLALVINSLARAPPWPLPAPSPSPQLTQHTAVGTAGGATGGTAAALSAFLDGLAQRLSSMMPFADGRTVSMATWSFAALRHPAPVLFNAAATRALQIGLGAVTPARSHGGSSGSAGHEAAFDNQAFSNLLWSFATANVPAPRLFQAAATAVASRSPTLREPQHVANIAWALARGAPVELWDGPARTAGSGVEAALGPLARAAVACAPRMLPQELTSTALAFATLRWRDEALMAALAAAATRFLLLVGRSSPSQLVGAERSHPGAPHASSPDVIDSSFDGASVSNLSTDELMSSGSSSGSGSSSSCASGRLLSPQMLSNLLWACARLEFADAALLQAAVEQIDAWMQPTTEMKSKASAPAGQHAFAGVAAAAETVVATATTARRAPEAAAAQTINPAFGSSASSRSNPDNFEDLSGTDAATLAWALCLLKPAGHRKVLAGLLAAAAAVPLTDLTLAGRSQLYQILWVEQMLPERNGWEGRSNGGLGMAVEQEEQRAVPSACTSIVPPADVSFSPVPPAVMSRSPPVLPADFIAACRAAWVEQATATRSSHLEDSVCKALRAVCSTGGAGGSGLPRRELLIGNGTFSVDLAVQYRGRWVGVEVDGPSHFTLSSPTRLMGEAALRRQCLEELCDRRTSVPTQEASTQGGGGGGVVRGPQVGGPQCGDQATPGALMKDEARGTSGLQGRQPGKRGASGASQGGRAGVAGLPDERRDGQRSKQGASAFPQGRKAGAATDELTLHAVVFVEYLVWQALKGGQVQQQWLKEKLDAAVA